MSSARCVTTVVTILTMAVSGAAHAGQVSEERVQELVRQALAQTPASRPATQPTKVAGDRRADRSHPRRGGETRVREEPRHRRRAPQSGNVRSAGRGAARSLLADRDVVAGRQRGDQPADQSADRWRAGHQRHQHLQRRCHAAGAVVRRQLQRSAGTTGARRRRARSTRSIRSSTARFPPRSCSPCCAASRSTAPGSS